MFVITKSVLTCILSVNLDIFRLTKTVIMTNLPAAHYTDVYMFLLVKHASFSVTIVLYTHTACVCMYPHTYVHAYP